MQFILNRPGLRRSKRNSVRILQINYIFQIEPNRIFLFFSLIAGYCESKEYVFTREKLITRRREWRILTCLNARLHDGKRQFVTSRDSEVRSQQSENAAGQ